MHDTLQVLCVFSVLLRCFLYGFLTPSPVREIATEAFVCQLRVVSQLRVLFCTVIHLFIYAFIYFTYLLS